MARKKAINPFNNPLPDVGKIVQQKNEFRPAIVKLIEDELIKRFFKIGLANSDIIKNFKVNLIQQNNAGAIVYIFEVQLPFYWEFIHFGRLPQNEAAPLPPINDLLIWMNKRGLGTDINLAFKIAYSINKKGIKPRDILGVEQVIQQELVKMAADPSFYDTLNRGLMEFINIEFTV